MTQFQNRNSHWRMGIGERISKFANICISLDFISLGLYSQPKIMTKPDKKAWTPGLLIENK
jgi:hypothetical protein